MSATKQSKLRNPRLKQQIKIYNRNIEKRDLVFVFSLSLFFARLAKIKVSVSPHKRHRQTFSFFLCLFKSLSLSVLLTIRFQAKLDNSNTTNNNLFVCYQLFVVWLCFAQFHTSPFLCLSIKRRFESLLRLNLAKLTHQTIRTKENNNNAKANQNYHRHKNYRALNLYSNARKCLCDVAPSPAC